MQAQFAAEGGVRKRCPLSLAAGTTVTANGVTFDPAIADGNTPLDPLASAAVSAGRHHPISDDPSLVYHQRVQTASSALDYLRNGNRLVIRHKWRAATRRDSRHRQMCATTRGVCHRSLRFGGAIEVVEVQGFQGGARGSLRVEATRFPFSPNGPRPSARTAAWT